MTLPNFIISGFPKCGTTSLHYYLSEHPEIYMPDQKELHFFTNKIFSDENKGAGDSILAKTHIKNLKNYQKCFEKGKNYRIIGETSPSYINYPKLFPKISKTLSNPKIIVLIRDPIKRAYSNYLHLLREQRETLSFEEALKQEEIRKALKYADFWYYKFNSTYYKKISKAIEVFSNVLIITQEELSQEPRQTIKKTYEFLGADPEFKPKSLTKTYNPGGVYKKNIVTSLIFKPSLAKNILKRAVPVRPWMKDILNGILARHKSSSQKINNKTQKYLINYFRKEVEEIKKLGVDTSKWNNYN
tara:strand:- start:9638 stop:10540 length:903 start_codon:yes stop_codon:yes gene_type:complete